jgi:predicted  nucleic acid-binding Zn-ribbon protein
MNPVKRFFQEDIPAVFSSGKWRIHLAQLNNKLKQIEFKKTSSIAELGKKAWAGKVKDEKYGEIYKKLEECEEQIEQARQEIRIQQEKLESETDRLKSITAEHDSQLKVVEEPHRLAMQKMAQLQNHEKGVEQQILALQKGINQDTASIKNLQILIDQTQAENPPDKEAKIESLNNTIDTTRAKILESNRQLGQNEEKKISNHAEQKKLKENIESLSQQIETLKRQKASALKPIQDQISLLNHDIQGKNEKKNSLDRKIIELMPEFGALVNKTRPTSEYLSNEYANVDALQSEVRSINDEINVTMARIASVNSQSIKRFFIAIAGLAALTLILILVVPPILTGNKKVASETKKIAGEVESSARGILPVIAEAEINKKIEKKIGVNPPNEGFYFVSENLTAEEIKPKRFLSSSYLVANFQFIDFGFDQQQYDNLPEYPDKLPVILFKSYKKSLEDYKLYQGSPVFGIWLEEDLSPCTVDLPSHLSSFKEKDIIYGLDGVEFNDCKTLQNIMLSKEPFTTIAVDTQRGTVRSIKRLIPPTISFSTVVSTRNQYVNGDHYAIYPSSEIEPGAYCFIHKDGKNDGTGYCFRIK